MRYNNKPEFITKCDCDDHYDTYDGECRRVRTFSVYNISDLIGGHTVQYCGRFVNNEYYHLKDSRRYGYNGFCFDSSATKYDIVINNLKRYLSSLDVKEIDYLEEINTNNNSVPFHEYRWDHTHFRPDRVADYLNLKYYNVSIHTYFRRDGDKFSWIPLYTLSLENAIKLFMSDDTPDLKWFFLRGPIESVLKKYKSNLEYILEQGKIERGYKSVYNDALIAIKRFEKGSNKYSHNDILTQFLLTNLTLQTL